VLWAKDTPVTDAIDDAEIDTRTGVDIYREVCTTKLLQTPIILGGSWIIVQVDESLFRHKPKVSYHGQNHKIHVQTQNNRGRHTQQEIWVLGMVDSCSWIYGDCSTKRCCNSVAHHQFPCLGCVSSHDTV